MFAAMIFGLTMLHVPIGAGGYIHVGDAVIYVTAMLMGGPWAFISAAIGAACADIVSGFAVYAVPSAIIKILIAVPFVLISKKAVQASVCAFCDFYNHFRGYYGARLFCRGSDFIQGGRNCRSSCKYYSGGRQRRSVYSSCFCA